MRGGDEGAAVLAVLEMDRKLGQIDIGAGDDHLLHRRFVAADLDEFRLEAQPPEDFRQQVLRRNAEGLREARAARERVADQRMPAGVARTARPSDWLRARARSRTAWWRPAAAPIRSGGRPSTNVRSRKRSKSTDGTTDRAGAAAGGVISVTPSAPGRPWRGSARRSRAGRSCRLRPRWCARASTVP